MLFKSPTVFPINEQTPLHQPPTLAYSVVIPLFNHAYILPELHRRVAAVMASLGQPYEIVYVDDGSGDNTFAVLSEVYQTDPTHIKGLRLLRNFGQHPAVTAGFEQTGGQIVITLDADLQNPPEEVPKLLEKLAEGYDVVVGWRQMRQDSLLRTLPSKFINWLISRSTGVKLHDYGSMLRVYRREVVQLLNQTEESAKFITALTSWLGANIVEVPVRHEATAAGQSRYNFRRLFRMTIDLATGYSMVPIQIVTAVGLLMAAIGISSGLFLLAWRVISGTNITGLSSFIALLLVLFGIQLAGLGIVGEYIGRIYVEVRGRPYYLIRTILARKEEPAHGDTKIT
ncbi:MAG: glycosyltransferase [Anaerolineae bacterium]|nr:glycosyltransferase [Anaerolineae bacterium]